MWEGARFKWEEKEASELGVCDSKIFCGLPMVPLLGETCEGLRAPCSTKSLFLRDIVGVEREYTSPESK